MPVPRSDLFDLRRKHCKHHFENYPLCILPWSGAPVGTLMIWKGPLDLKKLFRPLFTISEHIARSGKWRCPCRRDFPVRMREDATVSLQRRKTNQNQQSDQCANIFPHRFKHCMFKLHSLPHRCMKIRVGGQLRSLQCSKCWHIGYDTARPHSSVKLWDHGCGRVGSQSKACSVLFILKVNRFNSIHRSDSTFFKKRGNRLEGHFLNRTEMSQTIVCADARAKFAPKLILFVHLATNWTHAVVPFNEINAQANSEVFASSTFPDLVPGFCVVVSQNPLQWLTGCYSLSPVSVGWTLLFVLGLLWVLLWKSNIIKQFNCMGAVLSVLLLCGLSLMRPGPMWCFWPFQGKVLQSSSQRSPCWRVWCFSGLCVGGRHWIDGSQKSIPKKEWDKRQLAFIKNIYIYIHICMLYIFYLYYIYGTKCAYGHVSAHSYANTCMHFYCV